MQTKIHALLARNAFEQMQHNLSDFSCIQAYELGVQGPNPFSAFQIQKKKKHPIFSELSYEIHTQNCGAFLRAMIFRAYTPAQRSYVLGFLAHYAIDTVLYPLLLAKYQQEHPLLTDSNRFFCNIILNHTFSTEQSESKEPDNFTLSGAFLSDITALLKPCIAQIYQKQISQEELADAFHYDIWMRQSVLNQKNITSKLLSSYFLGKKRVIALQKITDTQLISDFSQRAVQEAVRVMKITIAYWLGVANEEQLAVALGDKNYLTGKLSELF